MIVLRTVNVDVSQVFTLATILYYTKLVIFLVKEKVSSQSDTDNFIPKVWIGFAIAI